MSQTDAAGSSGGGFADPAGSWNQRFAADGYLFGTEPNAWLREHAAVWQAGQRVLCVADGEGRNSVWLAQRGVRVDAFDIAEVGVAKARRLAGAQGVTVNFQVADCDSFAWPEAHYDGVAAIFVQFADPALRERLFAHAAAAGLHAAAARVPQRRAPLRVAPVHPRHAARSLRRDAHRRAARIRGRPR